MTKVGDLFDKFFSAIEDPNAVELARLRAENAELKAIIQRSHRKGCFCDVCYLPKTGEKA